MRTLERFKGLGATPVEAEINSAVRAVRSLAGADSIVIRLGEPVVLYTGSLASRQLLATILKTHQASILMEPSTWLTHGRMNPARFCSALSPSSACMVTRPRRRRVAQVPHWP